MGNIYEKTVDPHAGTTETKYYYAGGQRIAMRLNGTLSYLLSDHLGSTTVTTDANGALVSELKYKPWGEVRSGTAPTDYTFTGQYSNVSDFGLMFYNARWYDPSLGRFASADSVVPAGIQGYDRYAYVNNSPLMFTDPTGHFGNHNDDKSDYWNKRNKEKVRQLEKQWDDEKALKNLKQMAQATSKEMALDPSLGVAGAFGGGKGLYGPVVPPSPFFCGWLDCGLSAVSVVASAVTLVPVPVVAGVALAVDVGATAWASIRTGIDYFEGDITLVRAIGLEATGILGLVPGEFGVGISVINAWFTFSGQPR